MIKPFIYKGVCCIMKENDNDNRFINNVNIDYELLHYSSTLFIYMSPRFWIMKKKRWHIMPRDTEKENTLIRELGVNPIVARLMVNRNIDGDEGHRFLEGTLKICLIPLP